MEKLIMPKRWTQEMILHCLEQKPDEACGIMGGNKGAGDWMVETIYFMQNTRSSPEEYLMDPEEQFAVFRDLRENQYELLSIFHSHPQTEAVPSERDRKQAYYPDAVYTIVSLRKESPEIRGYQIRNGCFREVTVEIDA